MRRASLLWGCVLSLLLPACSLLFDGSSYRPPAGGDGGSVCTLASCGLGQRCDLTTGMCALGCDEDDDCPGDELCDVATHMCDGFTGCIDDTDCATSEYCDPLGACIACDADEDGWAPVDAPVARCVVGSVVGINDCAPSDATVNPLALPDCDGTSNDTCEAESHFSRLVATDGIELGATALREVTAPGPLLPGSLRVHVLAASEAETTVLLLAQLDDAAHTPVFQVFPLREGPLAGMPVLTPLASWDTTNTVDFAVGSMALGTAGVDIVVVERQRDSSANYRFLRAMVDGRVIPAAPQVLDVGGAAIDSLKSLAVGRNGPERPVIGLLEVVTGSTTVLLALQPMSQARVTGTAPGLGIALDGRSFAAFRQAGGLGFWNGDTTPAFASTPFAMSARPAFASSPSGTTLGFAIDRSSVTSFAGNCVAPATALAPCVSSRTGTVGFGMDLATEPLVTADWAFGDVFGVAARFPMGAALLFTLLDAPSATPHGSGGLVLPVPATTRPFVEGATDGDMGIHTVVSRGLPTRVAAGLGITGGSTVRVMAIHVCVGALP